MNTPALCLYYATLFSFSNISTMNSTLKTDSYEVCKVSAPEVSNTSKATLIGHLFKINSDIDLNKEKYDIKTIENIKKFVKDIKDGNLSIGDDRIVEFDETIVQLKKWLTTEWQKGKLLPNAIQKLIGMYNDVCRIKAEKDKEKKDKNKKAYKKILDVHNRFKSACRLKLSDDGKAEISTVKLEPRESIGEFLFDLKGKRQSMLKKCESGNGRWIVPHKLQGDKIDYKTLFDGTIGQSRGCYAVEIGGLISGEYFKSKNKTGKLKELEKFKDLNNHLRIIIKWEQDDSGCLISEPKMYLSFHYSKNVDIGDLVLARIDKSDGRNKNPNEKDWEVDHVISETIG